MREPVAPAEIHPRKRKKISPASPFASVLTRSRSRIFSHHNRSGFSRRDQVFRKPNAEMESLESFTGLKCRGDSRVFMAKDLRHKRVFSPDVVSVPEEENVERKKLLKGFDASTEESRIVRSEAESESVDGANGLNLKDREIHGNSYSPKIKMVIKGCRRRKVFKTPSSFSYRRLLPHLIDIVKDTSSVSKIEIVDAGSPCKIPKLDGINLKTRSVAENRCAAKSECAKPSENPDLEKVHAKVFAIQPNLSTVDNDVEEKLHENDVNAVDASVEEHIQTTPPDTGLFAKVEDGYVEESVDANKVLAESQSFVWLPFGREKNSSDTMKQSPNTKCGNDSMNTMVLNPSRVKLFKNPRSLSYRRLLPFLMDISKNTSCSSRKPQPKTPHVVSEEDRLPAPAPYTEQDTAKQNNEKKPSDDLIQSSSFSRIPLPALDGSSPESNKKCISSTSDSSTTGGYSSNISPRSTSLVTLPDTGMLNGFLTEETPRTQNNPTKAQPDVGSKESGTVSEQSSIVNNGILTQQCTFEVPRSVEKRKMCLGARLELHSGNAEPIESISLEQHSFQIKGLDALGCPNNRPSKGILKRNTRGCRGLCNCLNCASFRLHAERAFEFSRNQLHDAGEVASELMKELANLRLLLQKSITENDDSSSIRPHPVLIKQACNKALEAETLARERFDELNYDLNVHCKTPVLLQPKVTFAYNNLMK